jgi:hypothetical protein
MNLKNKTLITIFLGAGVVAGSYWGFNIDSKEYSGFQANIESTPSEKSITQIEKDETKANFTYNNQSDDIKVIKEKLAFLESKLKLIEEKNNLVLSTASNIKTTLTKEPTKPEAKKFTQNDFGKWLDNILDSGGYDDQSTQPILSKADKALLNSPETQLNDMRCSKEFCRATVKAELGNKLDDSSLLIAFSEFSETGFTRNESDGSVKVYFSQSRKSMDALQTDAENDFKSNDNFNN